MTMCQEPPLLHPNEIDAMYTDMRNSGWYYVGLMNTVTLNEWRLQQLARWRGVHGEEPSR